MSFHYYPHYHSYWSCLLEMTIHYSHCCLGIVTSLEYYKTEYIRGRRSAESSIEKCYREMIVAGL